MVECRNCQRNNTVDSTYCRGCGHPLDESDVQAAREQIEKAISEGYSQFNNGFTDAALRVATTCLEWDRFSSSALSLLGMCHERNGNLAEALKCYEKVLEQNPGSALDKIKVDQLREAISGKSSRGFSIENPRKVAMIAAAAAMSFVVLGAVGSLLLRPKPVAAVAKNDLKPIEEGGAKSIGELNNGSTPPPAGSAAANGANGANSVNGANPNAANTQQPAADPNATNPNSDNPVQSQPVPGSQNNVPTQSEGDAQQNRQDLTKAKPRDDEDTNQDPPRTKIPSNPRPVVPTLVAEPDPAPTTRIGTNTPTNPAPQQQQGGGSKNDPDPTPSPVSGQSSGKSQDGVIEITVSKGSGPKKAIGGSEEAVSSRAQVQFLTKTATESFAAGNYSRAVKEYEAIVKAGGDSAKVRYRLGQCYENLGRKQEAIRSYNKAGEYYERQLKTAGGKDERLQNLVELCRSQAKLLGG